MRAFQWIYPSTTTAAPLSSLQDQSTLFESHFLSQTATVKSWIRLTRINPNWGVVINPFERIFISIQFGFSFSRMTGHGVICKRRWTPTKSTQFWTGLRRDGWLMQDACDRAHAWIAMDDSFREHGCELPMDSDMEPLSQQILSCRVLSQYSMLRGGDVGSMILLTHCDWYAWWFLSWFKTLRPTAACGVEVLEGTKSCSNGDKPAFNMNHVLNRSLRTLLGSAAGMTHLPGTRCKNWG